MNGAIFENYKYDYLHLVSLMQLTVTKETGTGYQMLNKLLSVSGIGFLTKWVAPFFIRLIISFTYDI